MSRTTTFYVPLVSPLTLIGLPAIEKSLCYSWSTLVIFALLLFVENLSILRVSDTLADTCTRVPSLASETPQDTIRS